MSTSTTDTAPFTGAELGALLGHSDARVRSLADWTLEALGIGWRRLPALTSPDRARELGRMLADRLADIASAPALEPTSTPAGNACTPTSAYGIVSA